MKIRGFCRIFIARGKPWEKASTTPTANANRRDAFIAERIYEIDANLTILDKTVWWADASIYVNIYGANCEHSSVLPPAGNVALQDRSKHDLTGFFSARKKVRVAGYSRGKSRPPRYWSITGWIGQLEIW